MTEINIKNQYFARSFISGSMTDDLSSCLLLIIFSALSLYI